MKKACNAYVHHERPQKGGQPVARLKQSRPWEHPIDYQKELKRKGRPCMYFKVTAGRHSGRRNWERFYCVYESGLMVYVDVNACRISVAVGIGLPYQMKKCSAAHYQKALQTVKNLIDETN